jgi:transient receptor potential cation channel subfamily M protein 3
MVKIDFLLSNCIFNSIKGHVGKQNIPVVCVIVEGGTNTIRTVLEYVTEEPPVESSYRNSNPLICDL